MSQVQGVTHKAQAPERVRLQALSDDQLVALARHQLPYVASAYEVLMARYTRELKAYCRNVCRVESDAEDALQETMLRVYHNLARFRAESTFKTWMYRIAHNESINVIRKRRDTVDISDVDEVEFVEEPNFTQVDQGRFSQLMMLLDEADRSVVSLRLVAEMDFKDIAAITQSGLSAVKMRYQRALEKLRTRMEDM